MLKKIFAAAGLWLAATTLALAQTNPGLYQGQKLTPAQWNALFASKQDTLGYTPLNQAGGQMLGRLVTAAPGASQSGLNLIPGTAPGSPADGDLWVTSASFFARVNGATYDLLTYACPTCAVTNATNTFTAAQVVNINGGATPTALGGALLQVVGANSTTARIEIDVFGATARFTGVRANGTLSVPTPVVAADEIVSLQAWGYDGTARVGPYAAVRAFGDGTWTSTSHPTFIDFATTDSTPSAALTSRMKIWLDGGVTIGSPTGSSGGSGTLNIAGAIYNNGTAPTGTGGYVRSISPTVSGTFTLGLTGVSAGAAAFANATSGAISVVPPAGALGSVTNTLQAANDTFVYRATTDTLTNKTLSASSNVLGGVTMTLGSDATGDMYYRNSGGVLTRLGIGSNTQIMTVSGGLPSWQPGTAASTVNVGTTTITGTCSTLQLLYNNAGTSACENQSSTLTAGGGITLSGTTNVTIAQRAPTVQVLTSGSGATYTTPAGVAYIRVRGCGGGGGSGSSAGGTGGTTSFSASTMSATGGAGSSGTTGATAAGGTGANGQINYTGGSGIGTVTGVVSFFSPSFPGGGSFMFPAYSGAPPVNSCGGAGSLSGTGAASYGGAGAGGGGFERVIASPSASYTYTIGAGGTAGTSGQVGGSGVIVVEEF